MRVVITGGAGFIGGNLSKALADGSTATSVVVLDDLSTGRRENVTDAGIDLREGSILDETLLDDLFRHTDAIVHLAARPSVPRSLDDPHAAHEINATGTLRVLDAARRNEVAHVVVASSSSVYGDREALPKTEMMPPDPLSPYAASKLATEAYARAYASSFGLHVLMFRFFNVFGPLQAAGHDYAAAVPAFIDAAVKDQPIPIFGDGYQTRDFTYVGTVVRVLQEALARRVTSREPVNLAFGTRRSLLEVVEHLESIFERALKVEHLPPRPGDVRDSQADAAQLKELFPDLEPTPFVEGLAETVRWFQARS